MSSIPLGLSAYKRADLPPVALKNMFYERTPANLEDQVALFPRPRIKQHALAGAGPVRGVFHQGGAIAGRVLALSAANLYRVEAAPAGVGTATLVGAMNGANRLSVAANASTAVLTAGASVYSTDGVTLTPIAVPDGQSVIAVDTLNSRFLFAMKDSGRFYWTSPGGITIDALDYATAESKPDNLTTLKVIGDVLWLVGRASLEPWQPTGDLDLPYQRIAGRTFGIGCIAADTAQKMTVNGSETLCWTGADRKVYRLAPNPIRISDEGIEERLGAADPASLYAEPVSWGGHDFYLLHIPGQGSWACDLSTGLWDEWTSFGRSLFRGAVATVGPNDRPLLGDDTAGILWELTDAERSDAGDPVVFEWTGRVENAGGPLRNNNVSLMCSTGSNPDPLADPMVEMAMSDDDGATFDALPPEPIGRTGERLLRLIWSRLGMIGASRIFRWRTTEPLTVRKAKLNEVFR